MIRTEELWGIWQFILLIFLKHVRPTHCFAHHLKTDTKPYNVCKKKKKKNPRNLDKDAPQWSQFQTQEPGLGEQSGSLRTGELEPTLSLPAKFCGRGGSKEERVAPLSRAKAALGHRNAPTSAAPPSPRGSGPARAIRG